MEATVSSKQFMEDVAIAARYLTKLDNIKGKTIVITGATGLIGRMLVYTLAKLNRDRNAGITIIAISRNFLKANSLFNLILKDNVYIYSRDITKRFEVEDIGVIDIMVHAAADTNSKNMMNEPVKVINSIFSGTQNVLNFAVQHKVKKFIFLSSMEVYGTTTLQDGPITESFNGRLDLRSTRTSYPEAKRLAELLVYSYGEKCGFKSVVLRLTQTFGPGVNLNDGRVFAVFARQALQHENIVLKTKGETIRSYLYVRDAITALLHVMVTNNIADTFNVSNEKVTISIYEMATIIADIVGNGVKIVIEEQDSKQNGFAPTLKMQLSSHKLMMTGWEPQIGVQEMFERLLASLVNQI